MNTLYLISRDYYSNNNMLKEAQEIANEQDVLFTSHKQKGYIEACYTHKNGHPNGFEVYFYDIDYFLETKKNNSFKQGYGCLGTVEFDFEDPVLFQLLKKMFNRFPEMLVYFDELNGAEFPSIYSIRDWDNNNSLQLLLSPQQN